MGLVMVRVPHGPLARRCPRRSDHPRPPSRRSTVTGGTRASEHRGDTPCRKGWRSDSRVLPSLCHVAPSVVSGLVGKLLGSSPISCPLPLVARPSTRAPSLRRRYPASTVLLTHPPLRPARPVPHGLPVGRCLDHRVGFPVLRLRSVQTCRRHYPGGTIQRVVARCAG
jgi:hypothetical protein